MDILKKYLEFRAKYDKYKKIFEELAEIQKPHTLFISCSDSRVIPELITNSLPGEIFVIRNVANTIPPYKRGDISNSVASGIEFAVLTLNVKNIVVCGHSNCGGCKALFLEEEFFNTKPHLKNWIEINSIVRDKALELTKNDPSKLYETSEKINVVEQINNLMTYPFVRKRVEKGETRVYGWYFLIKTGEIYNYNFDTKKFEVIK